MEVYSRTNQQGAEAPGVGSQQGLVRDLFSALMWESAEVFEQRDEMPSFL